MTKSSSPEPRNLENALDTPLSTEKSTPSLEVEVKKGNIVIHITLKKVIALILTLLTTLGITFVLSIQSK